MMRRRRSRTSPVFATLALLAALASSACGGGGDESGSDVPPLPAEELVAFAGVVLAGDGEPLVGVSVRAEAFGTETLTGPDGSFTTTVPRNDPRIRVGGDAESSFVVDADAARSVVSRAGGGAEVELRRIARPFFLALAEEEGVLRAVTPGSQPRDLVVDDPSLPELALTVRAGSTVTLPEGAAAELFIVGLGTDRLPLPLPDARLARMGVMVGPLGATFSPAAEIELPNADGLAPGTRLDLIGLDPAGTGWRTLGELTVADGGASITGGRVSEAGTFVALPRTEGPRTRVEGRIVGSGREPLEGYVVLAPGGRSTLSGPDGFFAIPDVAVAPGEPFRLQCVSPPEFRHEFVVTQERDPVIEAAAGAIATTDFGNVDVLSVLRTSFPPQVSYIPGTDEVDVDEVTRVRVRFDRRMDLSSVDLDLVRGISREQKGVDGTRFLRFVGDGMELEFVAIEPLRNGEFYTVFVPLEARDLEGNMIEADRALSRFTVRDEPFVPDDRELRVISVEPNDGIAGDAVTIRGIHLNPAEVRFGASSAFVADFDDELREFLVVHVPDSIAGEVPVRVKDLDDELQGELPFRALPVVDTLDAAGAVPGESGDLEVSGLGAHLGPAPTVVWNGVAGGAFAAVADDECALQVVLRRSCFRLTLPRGVSAGSLHLEVEGFRTRGFFVAALRPLAETPIRVLDTSVDAGGIIGADQALVLELSAIADGASRVVVTAAGEEIAAAQSIVHRQMGISEIHIEPPAGGWPRDAEVRIRAESAGVRDLAGRGLDQDAATPASDAFTLELRGAPAVD